MENNENEEINDKNKIFENNNKKLNIFENKQQN